MSRALDDERKIPLLGFERAVIPGWDKNDRHSTDQWAASHLAYAREWQKRFTGTLLPVTDSSVTINRQGKAQQATHGCFDNHIGVITATIARIAGSNPVKPVEWLDY